MQNLYVERECKSAVRMLHIPYAVRSRYAGVTLLLQLRLDALDALPLGLRLRRSLGPRQLGGDLLFAEGALALQLGVVLLAGVELVAAVFAAEHPPAIRAPKRVDAVLGDQRAARCERFHARHCSAGATQCTLLQCSGACRDRVAG
eukprot:COSAG03_NODE_6540_length_1043_cov_10.246822_2_plen_146_part_00